MKRTFRKNQKHLSRKTRKRRSKKTKRSRRKYKKRRTRKTKKMKGAMDPGLDAGEEGGAAGGGGGAGGAAGEEGGAAGGGGGAGGAAGGGTWRGITDLISEGVINWVHPRLVSYGIIPGFVDESRECPICFETFSDSLEPQPKRRREERQGADAGEERVAEDAAAAGGEAGGEGRPPEQSHTLKNCKHKFHLRCIQNWAEQGNTDCPICRTPLADEDLQRETTFREKFLTGVEMMNHALKLANSHSSVNELYDVYRGALNRNRGGAPGATPPELKGQCVHGRRMFLLGGEGPEAMCARCGEFRIPWAKGQHGGRESEDEEEFVDEECTDIICKECFERRVPVDRGDLFNLKKNVRIRYTKMDNFPNAVAHRTRSHTDDSGEVFPREEVCEVDEMGAPITVEKVQKVDSSVPTGINEYGELEWRDTQEFAVYIYLSNRDIFGISYYPTTFREEIGPPWRGWDYVMMREREEGVGRGMPESIMVGGVNKYTLDPESVTILE